jgi:hypothetical protein
VCVVCLGIQACCAQHACLYSMLGAQHGHTGMLCFVFGIQACRHAQHEHRHACLCSRHTGMLCFVFVRALFSDIYACALIVYARTHAGSIHQRPDPQQASKLHYPVQYKTSLYSSLKSPA